MDPFVGRSSIISQAESWAVVAPSDAADLAVVPKALYFSAAGDVKLRGSDGNDVVFTVAAGQTLSVRPVRVLLTGTTVAAGKIIALY